MKTADIRQMTMYFAVCPHCGNTLDLGESGYKIRKQNGGLVVECDACQGRVRLVAYRRGQRGGQ